MHDMVKMIKYGDYCKTVSNLPCYYIEKKDFVTSLNQKRYRMVEETSSSVTKPVIECFNLQCTVCENALALIGCKHELTFTKENSIWVTIGSICVFA